MRRVLGQLLAVLAILGVTGCLAPTLPVPPPSPPEVSTPDPTSGEVTVTGDPGAVQPNAEVTVWNETYAGSAACKADPACAPGVVRFANTDGSYEVKIKAQSKDTLFIWESVGNQQSGEIEISVP